MMMTMITKLGKDNNHVAPVWELHWYKKWQGGCKCKSRAGYKGNYTVLPNCNSSQKHGFFSFENFPHIPECNGAVFDGSFSLTNFCLIQLAWLIFSLDMKVFPLTVKPSPTRQLSVLHASMWKKIVKRHRKSNDILKCKEVSGILLFHLLRKNIGGFVESFRNPNKIYLCEKRKAGWFCRDASIFEKIDLCRVDLRLRNLPEIFSENEIKFLPKEVKKSNIFSGTHSWNDTYCQKILSA